MGNCLTKRPRAKPRPQPSPGATRRVSPVANSVPEISEYTKPLLAEGVRSSGNGVGTCNPELNICGCGSPAAPADPAEVGIRRIKVIITKQQLRELVSQTTSVEGMLLELRRDASEYSEDSCRGNWRPVLATIPEETHL